MVMLVYQRVDVDNLVVTEILAGVLLEKRNV